MTQLVTSEVSILFVGAHVTVGFVTFANTLLI